MEEIEEGRMLRAHKMVLSRTITNLSEQSSDPDQTFNKQLLTSFLDRVSIVSKQSSHPYKSARIFS